MRYPYHRYLKYLVLNGDDRDEIRDHIASLEYIPPRADDVDELVASFRKRITNRELRDREDVLFFDDACDSLDHMFWIVETPVVRSCAERLLLDRVDPGSVSTILSLKFKHELTRKCVEMFRDGFWDTAVLGPVDFSEYFALARAIKPEPPPEAVSLTTRPHYSAWKEGLVPNAEELSVQDMVREIGVDSFMRFKELSSKPGTENQKQALAFAAMVLKTAPAAKSLSSIGGRRAGGDIPKLRPIVEYPEQDVPTLADLHRDYAEEQSGTGSVIDAMGLEKNGD